MTALDIAVPDHVVIRCPMCGAAESAEPSVLTGQPTIVCRECGETWPASPPRRKRSTDLVRRTKAHLESNVIDAERRALVTYSDGAEAAWSAKVEGDYWPEPPRRRHFTATVAATAAAIFLAAFFGGREAAVTAIPDLAGLYAAVGLPVHLDGIAIEEVAANRAPSNEGDRILVRGLVRNVSGAPVTLPPLAATLYDSAKLPARTEGFDPPARTIAAGATQPFVLALEKVPDYATQVAVRFRKPGEALPRGAASASSTP